MLSAKADYQGLSKLASQYPILVKLKVRENIFILNLLLRTVNSHELSTFVQKTQHNENDILTHVLS